MTSFFRKLSWFDAAASQGSRGGCPPNALPGGTSSISRSSLPVRNRLWRRLLQDMKCFLCEPQYASHGFRKLRPVLLFVGQLPPPRGRDRVIARSAIAV